MNLTAEWVDELTKHGWDAVHWSTVGAADADDATIMAWARSNHRVVFTHDLDFGTTIALTRMTGPSVIQVRGQEVLPEDISSIIVDSLKKYDAELMSGALIVIDRRKSRIRLLPI